MFNQLTETFSVAELARTVAKSCDQPVEIISLDNPRAEPESHYYRVVKIGLSALGLQPHLLSDTLIRSLLPLVRRYAGRVDRSSLKPTIRWAGATARVM